MRQIFEKRALSKRHQAGEKNTPIVVLTPPLRLTLGFGVVLAAVGVVWAFVARIPLEVNGTGVLLPVGVINSVRANVDGRARWSFAEQQYDWVVQAKRFQARPDTLSDREVLELARRILRSYSPAESPSGFKDRELVPDNKMYPKGTLLMWLQSLDEQEALQSQVDNLQSVGLLNRVQQRNLADRQSILERELKSRQTFLNSMQALAVKGFVSKPTLLQNQAEVDNLESKIFSNRDSLVKLQTELQQSFIKLRKSLAQMISNGFVFAENDLYIRQVIPNDGENINSGGILLLFSRQSLNSPSQVPVFLSARESAQVSAGMNVLVTPVGMRRSEVGGIRGRVIRIAKLPSGNQELEARLGVSTLAKVIQQREPSPTLAVVELERAPGNERGNRGGYVWNSNGDLPFAPKPADELTVSITSRRVAPISLVIPRLRRWLGLVPPETTQGAEKKQEQSSPSASPNDQVSR